MSRQAQILGGCVSSAHFSLFICVRICLFDFYFFIIIADESSDCRNPYMQIYLKMSSSVYYSILHTILAHYLCLPVNFLIIVVDASRTTVDFLRT